MGRINFMQSINFTQRRKDAEGRTKKIKGWFTQRPQSTQRKTSAKEIKGNSLGKVKGGFTQRPQSTQRKTSAKKVKCISLGKGKGKIKVGLWIGQELRRSSAVLW